MRSRILVLLLLGILLKNIVWLVTVPVWQTPDEQAHFAQVEFSAERRTLNLDLKNNLSTEIAFSEEVLGTRRDKFGNNKYTYHPEFNIPYTRSFVGYDESGVNNQHPSKRTRYIDSEASAYPPLYFVLSVPFYESVYQSGVIDRVFAVRLLSLVLGLALAVVAYFVGKLIWENTLTAVALAALVSFQPMVSFVGAGVHPDNLLDLLYSAGLLFCLKIIKSGLTLSRAVVLGAVVFLSWQTKIFGVFLIPVILSTLAFTLLGHRFWQIIVPLVILAAPVAAIIFRLPLPYIPQALSGGVLANLSFGDYLRFRVGKLAFEIWPWYWGVFKWLGVTLPLPVLRVITRLSILCGLGLAVKAFWVIRRRRFDFEAKAGVLFIISALSFASYLLAWDFRTMQHTGFSAGIQGRYFLPNIVGQSALLLIGWLSLWPKRWRRFGAILAIFLAVILNAIALFTVARSYYGLSSRQTFVTQFAQYKPGVVKALAKLVY